MEDALKEIFGPMFEAMLQGEMEDHLGYKANHHGHKKTEKVIRNINQMQMNIKSVQR